MFVGEWRYLEDWGANWFFGVEPSAFGCVGALINFAVAAGVSQLTREPPERIQNLVEDIRVPMGADVAHRH